MRDKGMKEKKMILASASPRRKELLALMGLSFQVVPSREKEVPEGLQVIGGKTGTTSDAGSCLVLYSKKGELPIISIVFKADNADGLYEEMTQLLKEI